VCGLARVVEGDVEAALDSGVDLVHVFVSTSDVQIEDSMHSTRDDVMERTTFCYGDSLNTRVAKNRDSLEKMPMPATEPSEKALSVRVTDHYRKLERVNHPADADQYVEAQYHGGLTVGEVKEVVFKGDPPSDELVNRLEASGLPYRHVDS